jgi:hypothetical protein
MRHALEWLAKQQRWSDLIALRRPTKGSHKITHTCEVRAVVGGIVLSLEYWREWRTQPLELISCIIPHTTSITDPEVFSNLFAKRSFKHPKVKVSFQIKTFDYTGIAILPQMRIAEKRHEFTTGERMVITDLELFLTTDHRDEGIARDSDMLPTFDNYDHPSVVQSAGDVNAMQVDSSSANRLASTNMSRQTSSDQPQNNNMQVYAMQQV